MEGESDVEDLAGGALVYFGRTIDGTGTKVVEHHGPLPRGGEAGGQNRDA